MNKEQILEAFYKERPTYPDLIQLIQLHSEVLTEEMQDPCNFDYEPEEADKLEIKPDKSEKSTFSEIGISQEKYLEILAERENRKIFSTLCDPENATVKMWFYKTTEKRTFGPNTAAQMDELFRNGVINEDTGVQGPTDFEFVDFRLVLRRYLKQLEVEQKEAKPGKVGVVKKEEKVRNHAKTTGLLIERKYRVLSLEVRPNLSFLDEIVEDSEYCEIIQTRGRSMTMG